jgi:gliding motility-associated lipoprotein GldH
MTRKVVEFLLCLSVIVLVASCNNRAVFEKYQSIPQSGWNKDSVVVFEIPVTDTAEYHNLLINVRNDVNYNYSNLWLFIELEQPDGKLTKDTFEITLADPAGKWLGEGFGKIRTRQVIYRRIVSFPVSGVYKVKIQQGMRHDVLPGVKDIGFRVEKSDS